MVTPLINLVTNPSFEAVTAGTTIVRTNACLNPALGTDSVGWNTYGGGSTNVNLTTARVANAAASSGWAWRVTGSATSTSVMAELGAAPVPVVVGLTYTASIYARAGANRAATLRIRPQGGAGDFTVLIALTPTLTRYSVTVTAAPTTTVMGLSIVGAGDAFGVGDYIEATQALFEQTDQLRPYFDGSTPAALGFVYAWTGTAHASTSTAKAAVVPCITNLAPNPSFDTVNTGTTIVRSNLRANPSAKVDAVGFSAYGGNGGASAGARVATGGPVGEAFYEATWSVATTSVSGGSYMAAVPVVNGTILTASAWVRSSKAQRLTLQVEFQDAGLVKQYTITGTPVDLVANVWTQVSVTATANAAVVWAQVVAYASNGGSGINWAAGDKLGLGRVLIEAGDQLRPYFDGDTPDALGYDYGWSGTANASTSTAKAAVLTERTNLINNPSFEVGTTLWSGSRADLTRATTGGLNNGPCAVVTVNAVGYFPRIIASGPIAVVAGATYTASAYVASASGNAHRIGLQWFDNTATALTTVEGATSTVNGARIFVTAVAPVGAVTVQFWLGSADGLAIGQTVGFDAAMLEASLVLGTYFDGSTPASGDSIYAWGGTANASVSVKSGVAIATGGSTANASVAIQSLGTLRIVPTSTTTNDTNVSIGTGDLGAIRLGMIAGKTYTALATVRLAAVQTGTINASARQIKVFTKAGVAGYVVTSSAQAANAIGSTLVRVTFTLSSDCTEAFIRLYNGAFSGGGDVYFDNFMLIEGTYLGPYFDGDSLNLDSDLILAWAGTPHASASVKSGVAVVGAQADTLAGAYSTPGATGRALAVQSKGTSSNAVIISPPSVIGRVYTLVVTARRVGGTDTKLRLFSNFAEGGGTLDSAANITTAWQEFRFTYTSTYTSAALGLYLFAVTTSQGQVIQFDKMTVIEGAYTGPHFDGASIGSSWEGAAHASRSLRPLPALTYWDGTAEQWVSVVGG